MWGGGCQGWGWGCLHPPTLRAPAALALPGFASVRELAYKMWIVLRALVGSWTGSPHRGGHGRGSRFADRRSGAPAAVHLVEFRAPSSAPIAIITGKSCCMCWAAAVGRVGQRMGRWGPRGVLGPKVWAKAGCMRRARDWAGSAQTPPRQRCCGGGAASTRLCPCACARAHEMNPWCLYNEH